jgi:hypothetical protein
MPRYTLLLIFLTGFLVFTLHLPFISADPDQNISDSRGPNTDEGLNTFQIRNYINHGDLTFEKSDNFIKTPLFGVMLFFPFQLFGTYLSVARITVLLLSLLICISIFKFNRYYAGLGLISLIVLFTEYYIFHFFHYSLAEIPSTTLIMLSVFVLARSVKKDDHLRSAFLVATFISLAWLLKIQFVYAVFIPLLTLIFYLLVFPKERKGILKKLLYSFGFIGFYLLLYYLSWYLPHREFYDFVMLNQTTDRFVSLSSLFDHLDFILHYFFYNDYLKWFTLSFYVLFIAGLVNLFTSKKDSFRLLFIGLSCWLLVELHKLPMTYLPTRYLISLIFPMGMIMSLVLWEFIQTKGKGKPVFVLKIIAILMLFSFGIKNTMDYYSSYQERKFNIQKINTYLSGYDFKERPVIGAWAPSLSWKSKALSFPIWKDYFNDDEVIENYNPSVIIAELDEEDSDGAFLSRGIDIDSFADSNRFFIVNRWELKILWIKTNQTIQH